MSDIKSIDLFAGVGGVRLGFENVGFNIVFSNDNSKFCKLTYDLNFNGSELNTQDIQELNISQLPDFDVLLAGFPCQAFSIAGYRNGFKDKKVGGNLFFKIAKILEVKRPKAVFLENVKNLKGHDKGKTFKIIKDTLERIGYHIKYEVLNSMTHGNMPQNRERIFIVGFLDKNKTKAFRFPDRIPLTKSFREYVAEKAEGKYYYNNKPLYNRIKKDIDSENTVYQWRRKYVRENKKGVVPTLTANMGTGGHNVPLIKNGEGIRKLTPKECFLLQGFPDSFKLPDIADSKLYHQAGNSVSIPVVERIAKEMRIVLEL